MPTSRVPPGFRQVGEEAARKHLRDCGHLAVKYVGHETSCRYFTTKNPEHCNCTPEIEYFHVAGPARKRGRR